jgi:hypothetical protein
LRAFLSLNNFEFNVIALLEALVSLRLDGTVVDEHIRAVIPADKAEALCVIEPFNFAFNSRHVPYSGAVIWEARSNCGPAEPVFSSLGLPLWEWTQDTEDLPSPGMTRRIPVLWLWGILPSSAHDVNFIYVLKKRRIMNMGVPALACHLRNCL